MKIVNHDEASYSQRVVATTFLTHKKSFLILHAQ